MAPTIVKLGNCRGFGDATQLCGEDAVKLYLTGIDRNLDTIDAQLVLFAGRLY